MEAALVSLYLVGRHRMRLVDALGASPDELLSGVSLPVRCLFGPLVSPARVTLASWQGLPGKATRAASRFFTRFARKAEE
jgi:hypothetical protein